MSGPTIKIKEKKWKPISGIYPACLQRKAVLDTLNINDWQWVEGIKSGKYPIPHTMAFYDESLEVWHSKDILKIKDIMESHK